jgi:hypothetical protein
MWIKMEVNQVFEEWEKVPQNLQVHLGVVVVCGASRFGKLLS